mmetsp:Transcript_13810/g.13875  ORF Transcript_13810/g.13875 Transcript_13810/m.13875 type:complete len:239 (-) Transcript_13810:33-749(-)
MSNQVVTSWYRSPELLFGARRYCTGVDQWAVGCIFAEIMLRTPLFPGTSDIEQLSKIFNVTGTPTSTNWLAATSLPNYMEFESRTPMDLSPLFSSQPASALSLLLSLLSLDPLQRPTAKETLAHEYFTTSPSLTPPLDLPMPTSVAALRNEHMQIQIKREREKERNLNDKDRNLIEREREKSQSVMISNTMSYNHISMSDFIIKKEKEKEKAIKKENERNICNNIDDEYINKKIKLEK